MFDFHLHLARFESSRALAKGLLDAGVNFNTIACEPWEWEKTLELMDEGQDAHYAFGIHPMVASKMTDRNFSQLEEILRANPDTDVGECGLDKRFEGYEPAGIQEQVFKRQVLLAQELNRPLHVHCVGDYSRILRILQNCTSNAKQHDRPVVLHRFGGDVSVVKSALKALGPQVLFSLHADSFRKKSTVAAIQEIPAQQIRFETDADESFAEKFGNSPDEIIKQLEAVQNNYKAINPKNT